MTKLRSIGVAVIMAAYCISDAVAGDYETLANGLKSYQQSMTECQPRKAFEMGFKEHPDAKFWEGAAPIDEPGESGIESLIKSLEVRCSAGESLVYQYELKALRVNHDIALVIYDDKMVAQTGGEPEVLWEEESNTEVWVRHEDQWVAYITNY